MSKRYLDVLERVANLPTAPFVEGHVADYIRGFVDRQPQLTLKADPFGNLLVRYTPRAGSGTRVKGRPILFAAHMDHPGFIAGKSLAPGRLEAQWQGGVQARFFKNEKIQFHVDGRWIPGRIERTLYPPAPKTRSSGRGKAPSRASLPPKAVTVSVKEPVPRGSLGMWALGDAVIRGSRFHARVCDDLSGLAAIVCTLDAACRHRAKSPCYALFTRAEEVGFAGALAALEGGTIPRNALIIAVECSREIPGVSLGGGPVLRVGDKLSIFSPAVTAYCKRVADELAERDKGFRYQRKLMDGGSCESTAYCHYGHAANCICLPLVNYHNMDTTRGRIAHEAIDVRDYVNLVKWFIALAESPAKHRFEARDPVIGKRLGGLLKQHRARLRRSAGPIREGRL